MELQRDSVDRWRGEAERARAAAAQMTDPEPQRIMRQIAEAYELLAAHAHKWAEHRADGSKGAS